MRIGEAAAAAGMSTKALRFYEERGLLPEAERSPNGYRDYGPAALSRLGFIARGRAAGLSLSQIGQILAVRDRGQAPCSHVRGLIEAQLAELDRQIDELTALRAMLAETHSEVAAGDPAACAPEMVCSYL